MQAARLQQPMKIVRLVELIAEVAEAAPVYRRSVTELERDQSAVVEELEDAERTSQQTEGVSLWSAADGRHLLGTLRDSLQWRITCRPACRCARCGCSPDTLATAPSSATRISPRAL